jgi:hypothetical protein
MGAALPPMIFVPVRRSYGQQSAITHLFAGVPVSDLDASLDCYTRFSGDPRIRASGKRCLSGANENHHWWPDDSPGVGRGFG